MLIAVKSYHKILKALMLSAALCLAQPSLAFDTQSVQKMHDKIGDVSTEIGQIKPQNADARKRIELVEAELIELRQRLSVYENRLVQTQQLLAVQNKLNDGGVIQTPLEDPYADAQLPLKPNATATATVIIVQQELNTVPKALRNALPTANPQAQAFVANVRPNAEQRNLVVTNLISDGNTVMGSLGNQAPDIMAFNEAKNYFDNEYFQLSEHKFNQFIQYYRDSSLISNAYFWLGESHYMRKNFNAAARVFYQGYRSNKKGAKAPDNLFRLASSLLMLGNKSDACAAFYEVSRRYSDSHPSLSEFAVEAQKEQAC